MSKNINTIENISGGLLKQFNNRDCDAFGQVYLRYVNEFVGFADRLFKNSSADPQDVIHDIFVNLWNSKLTFLDFSDLKAYIYRSIHNKFKDYIRHSGHVSNYKREMLLNDDFMVCQIAEIETLSLIHRSIDLLPSEFVETFKLYLEGWKTKDIAQLTGRSERTIQYQRQRSIEILEKKLDPDKLHILLLLLT